MSKNRRRNNQNYNVTVNFNGTAALARNRAAAIIDYDRKEIHVMDLRPTRSKPSTSNGWVEYKRYKKLKRRMNGAVVATSTALVAVASCFCATVIQQHNTEMAILESYDYEFRRACEKEEQLHNAKASIVEIENYAISLEYQNKALIESLEDSTNMINALTIELDAATSYIDEALVAPSTKEYTAYTDLGITDIMSVDRMNRIIDYWISRNGATDSPFIGMGEAFIKASQESGLDPIFIFALSAHESDFGRTRIARDKYNYMGIGAYDATPYSSATSLSDNVEGGLVAGAKWVSDRYYNKGQTTLHDMIYGPKMYSTSKDSWIAGIESIMKMSATIQ